MTSGAAYQPGSEDRRKLSAMACAIPGVGQAYMGYMAVTGHDAISGTCLSVGERAFIAATFAVPAATKYLSRSKWLRCLLGGGCFVAGTPVQVATQEEASRQLAKKEAVAGKSKPPERLHTVTKPIEQVREGDLVASRNPVSGKTELRRVVATRVRTVTELLIVSLADAKTGKVVETISTTSEHPFAVEGRGFVPAGRLAIGNAIVTRAGPALVVKSLTVQAHKESVRVYNFAVDGNHTYFVGTANGGTWVHNAYFGDAAKLAEHFANHGADFRSADAAAYERQASNFLTGPSDAATLTRVRPNGDTVMFNPRTGEFGVQANNGVIRTYYKPDPALHGFPTNLDYFNAQ